MKTVTTRAHSNVALLKYWGRNNNQLRLPANNSISLNLDGLVTTTTISEASEDIFALEGQLGEEKESQRVFAYLDSVVGKERPKCKVESSNSFPARTGLSSSASGFAALATATNAFFSLGMDERRLTVLARKGSGSAARSIPEGIVKWQTADQDAESFAFSLHKADYWDLRVLCVVVSNKSKVVPTSGGHETAQTSPYFQARMQIIEERERVLVEALKSQNFSELGEAVEREMFEFHAIPMTSNPPLVYWFPETLMVVHAVRAWRQEGIEGYATINTGHNVFILCLPDTVEALSKKLRAMPVVSDVIPNKIGLGSRVVDSDER